VRLRASIFVAWGGDRVLHGKGGHAIVIYIIWGLGRQFYVRNFFLFFIFFTPFHLYVYIFFSSCTFASKILAYSFFLHPSTSCVHWVAVAGVKRTDGATIITRNDDLTFFLFSCRRYIIFLLRLGRRKEALNVSMIGGPV
jgi:hypothetical protein